MTRHIPIPTPINEPVHDYPPGSHDRVTLKAQLAEMSSREIDIPLVIGGTEVRTGRTKTAVMPHAHRHVLATWQRAGAEEARQAIAAAAEARREWSSWRWEDRAAVFLRAADMLATTWGDTLNAATMLCQSKTVHQAEIDAVCEIVDFWRFNVHFANRLYADQPISTRGLWNRMDYRPLEGFVFAVTPFNFTSIGANLPTAPAIMGNTVVWKPASTAVFSSYYIFRLLEAAGLPPGVINFLPGDAGAISSAVLSHPELAGIHFTGSTAVFQQMWSTVGANIARYRSYPRLVGETGGKDFILAHPSANRAALLTGIVRGAYEYQGQKCSAASRLYLPESIWKSMREELIETIRSIPMGDIADFRNFMGAVIDKAAFDTMAEYIEHAKASADAEILTGGGCDEGQGYFVQPTLIRAKKPDYRSMCEEIFGPVLTLYVYPDKDWDAVLRMVDGTSPYALTGAVFSEDRRATIQAMQELRYAAGNFYLNDKPTGAVVGQQPFGGARASGTNDKAGSVLNLVRWISARSIKENYMPSTSHWYPYMEAE
jgi:1-pyrroline-5-carboxylate dehydrogenase